ncbi:MAG: hypothetical protein ACYSWP_20425 [Planctomycetota bacterium]|jgi:hypothetical protein
MERSFNKVDRTKAILRRDFREDNYVDAPADVLVSFIWELTKEICSLKAGFDPEQRLKRNVVTVIKQRG